MNKKGFFNDLVLVALIIFIGSIVFIVGSKVLSDFNTNFQATSTSTVAKDLVNDNSNKYSSVFDYVIITTLVLLFIIIMFIVYYLDVHPVFYFVGVIVFVILLIPAGIMGNFFEDFSDTPDMQPEIAKFTILPFIMENWVRIIGTFGVLAFIIMFAKIKGVI